MSATFPFKGSWSISWMEQWSSLYLLGPAFIRFESGGLGEIRFMSVQGWMDCRYSSREGRPFAEFSFRGTDAGEERTGRGWAQLQKDGSLSGQLFFHLGQDSEFRAVRRGVADHLVLQPVPCERMRSGE